MRKGRRSTQRQGWPGIFHTETLCRKSLSRYEIQKACTGHPESRVRACFPETDHGFQENHNFLQFVMWEKSTGQEYIVVPDEQMDSFIKIASQYEETTVYYKPEEIDVRKGTRVCIHGGKLDGVKGMFMRVKGKRNRRVVVMLEGIMGISAEVHPDLIEVIS